MPGVAGECQGGKGFIRRGKWGGHDAEDGDVEKRRSNRRCFPACSLLRRVLGKALSPETHLRFGFDMI